jgi:hypothetical protein
MVFSLQKKFSLFVHLVHRELLLKGPAVRLDFAFLGLVAPEKVTAAGIIKRTTSNSPMTFYKRKAP